MSLSIFSNCFLGLRFHFFPNLVLSSLLRMVFNLSGVKRVWCANRSPTLINSNNEFSLLSWQIRCEAFPFKCFLPHFLPQLLKVERMNGYAPSTLAFLFSVNLSTCLSLIYQISVLSSVCIFPYLYLYIYAYMHICIYIYPAQTKLIYRLGAICRKHWTSVFLRIAPKRCFAWH